MSLDGLEIGPVTCESEWFSVFLSDNFSVPSQHQSKGGRRSIETRECQSHVLSDFLILVSATALTVTRARQYHYQ